MTVSRVTYDGGLTSSHGQADVACSQLCGVGHYRMKAILRVVPEDEFSRWLASQKP